MNNKSILITGATGTIGSFLTDLFLQYNKEGANIHIYASGRNIDTLKKRFEKVRTEYLSLVQYDIMNSIPFNFHVDYIIHAAGNAHPEAFNSDPVGTIIGNVYGTYNLLNYALCHHTSRFCYISSGEVYGQSDIFLENFTESFCGHLDLTSPRSGYPSSKRAAETLCASFSAQYGLPTVIVRPSHTYGPGFTKNDSRAHAQFFRNVLENKDIILKSNGTTLRSYSYIADCASAIITCLLNGESGQAYNCSNPCSKVTIAEFAHIIAKITGKKIVHTIPNDLDIVNRTPFTKQVLSSEKIESLGWQGSFDVEKGIKHTLKILRGE